MADNYLEKRQEEYRAKAASGNTRKGLNIAQMLKKSASCSIDVSYKVRRDQLERLIDSAKLIDGAEEAFTFGIRMEEGAAVIITSGMNERLKEYYILLGRVIQVVALQAAEIGLRADAILFEESAVINIARLA